jgi:hypothetical protein
VARRLDELAKVCRKDDMSDEKTYSRMRGIMLSLPQKARARCIRRTVAHSKVVCSAGNGVGGSREGDREGTSRSIRSRPLKQPLQQQQLQETWHPSTVTKNHPFIYAIASDNNSSNGEQTMDDAPDDTYSDDDMDDGDSEWVLDGEDNGMAANEFDDNYQPPEQDVDEEMGDDGVPTQD